MNPLTVNLRHLVTKDLELKGEVPADDLQLNQLDELIHVPEPVRYDLQVQQMDQGILVTGRVIAQLNCECARCLTAFPFTVDLPDFAIQVQLEGEEAVVPDGDFVDLTPYLREDIVLAFPQHPLCKPGCAGLQKERPSESEAQPGHESLTTSSAWAVLNKLKL
jgi:uncharacterized protein